MIERYLKQIVVILRRPFIKTPVHIDSRSSMRELSKILPNCTERLREKYGIELTSTQKSRSLEWLCTHYNLGPAHAVFATLQLSDRQPQLISSGELQQMVDQDVRLVILDLRDSCERKRFPFNYGHTSSIGLIDSLAGRQKIVLVCHYGLRSLDAAAVLSPAYKQHEFIVLDGGLNSWAEHSGTGFPKYDGPACD